MVFDLGRVGKSVNWIIYVEKSPPNIMCGIMQGVVMPRGIYEN